jgi:hypothetical protein
MAKKITDHRDGAQIERASRVDSRYDNGHRDRRMEYTRDSNVTREAGNDGRGHSRSVDEKGFKLEPRTLSPQSQPFSNASQDCDRATTSQNYYQRKGMQPR